MSNKKNKTPALIPFQVKTKPETRARIVAEAEKRGLSANDIASMALSAGIDRVIEKLSELEPQKQAA